MKFLQKDINKFKECLTNESTKNIYGEKKESMERRETNSNASYCNWRPSTDWWGLRQLAVFAGELHHWCLRRLLMRLFLRRFPLLGLRKRILNSPCLLMPLINTKQKNKMKFRTDSLFLLPWRRTLGIHWVDKAKMCY